MLRAFILTILAFALSACSTDTTPVNFAKLRKSWKPNQYLACPKDYCQAEKPDEISPVFDLTVEQLQMRAKTAILNEPRTQMLFEETSKHQLVVVQRTEKVGFPDTIFIEFVSVDPEHSSLAIYSRANYGISDRGVNSNRVKAWLEDIKAAALKVS